jgi:hypothetical protein
MSALAALFFATGLGVFLFYSFMHSRIEYFEEFMIIRNPFTTIEIAWNEIELMEDRLNFSVTREGKTYSAWIAPRRRGTGRPIFYRVDRVRNASALTSADFERRNLEKTANPALYIAQDFARNFSRKGISSDRKFRRILHRERMLFIGTALSLGVIFSIFA